MTFTDSLERKCRKLARRFQIDHGNGPLGSIWREIELTLDHLDRARRTRDTLRKEFSRLEFELDNKLLNLQHVQYEPHSMWVEKEHIRNSLIQSRIRLESQRQRLVRDHEREQQTHRNRLFELWDRSYQCRLDDEPKRPARKARTPARPKGK